MIKPDAYVSCEKTNVPGEMSCTFAAPHSSATWTEDQVRGAGQDVYFHLPTLPPRGLSDLLGIREMNATITSESEEVLCPHTNPTSP